MRAGGTKSASPRPAQHDHACNGVPDAGRYQRGNGLDRVADGEISRPPDKVDGSEGERQFDGVGAVVMCRIIVCRIKVCRILAWNEHGSASDVDHLAAANQGHNLRRLMAYHDLTFKVLF